MTDSVTSNKCHIKCLYPEKKVSHRIMSRTFQHSLSVAPPVCSCITFLVKTSPIITEEKK